MSHILLVQFLVNGEREVLTSYRIPGKQRSDPDSQPAFILLYGTGKYTWQDQDGCLSLSVCAANREGDVTEERLFAHYKKAEAESEGLSQKTGRRWLLSSQGVIEVKGKGISYKI